MQPRDREGTRVAIVGMGLIGGSIALRLADSRPDVRVTAYDRVEASARAAVDAGAASSAAPSLTAAVADAELVIVAVPVDLIPQVLLEVAPSVSPGAVVTDVGSSKGVVAAAGVEHLGSRFVGGHPMAGSELHGFAAADPSLFEDASWILTPTPETSEGAYRLVSGLVADLGARPVALEPQAHDALLAHLSHLPQLLASTLVEVAAGSGDGSLLGLAANGFRDVTRIAASDPDMWLAILRTNRASIVTALDAYLEHLGEVKRWLSDERWEDLTRFLATARRDRLEAFAKPVPTGEPAIITLLIPDRPGVLAEVTTQAGELGANIDDLKIFHSPEGGRGRLELVIAGRDAAERLQSRLEGLGYHVERGLPE